MRKHFNENLVISIDDEKGFRSIIKCWICSGLFAEGNNKVRHHNHVRDKYSGSADWNRNII